MSQLPVRSGRVELPRGLTHRNLNRAPADGSTQDSSESLRQEASACTRDTPHSGPRGQNPEATIVTEEDVIGAALEHIQAAWQDQPDTRRLKLALLDLLQRLERTDG